VFARGYGSLALSLLSPFSYLAKVGVGDGWGALNVAFELRETSQRAKRRPRGSSLVNVARCIVAVILAITR